MYFPPPDCLTPQGGGEERGRGRRRRNSRKHPPLDGKGKRDDEDHEQSHLCHEQEEDLAAWKRGVVSNNNNDFWPISASSRSSSPFPYQAVVQSHLVGCFVDNRVVVRCGCVLCEKVQLTVDNSDQGVVCEKFTKMEGFVRVQRDVVGTKRQEPVVVCPQKRRAGKGQALSLGKDDDAGVPTTSSLCSGCLCLRCGCACAKQKRRPLDRGLSSYANPVTNRYGGMSTLKPKPTILFR